jgi:hypothetical protein
MGSCTEKQLRWRYTIYELFSCVDCGSDLNFLLSGKKHALSLPRSGLGLPIDGLLDHALHYRFGFPRKTFLALEIFSQQSVFLKLPLFSFVLIPRASLSRLTLLYP